MFKTTEVILSKTKNIICFLWSQPTPYSLEHTSIPTNHNFLKSIFQDLFLKKGLQSPVVQTELHATKLRVGEIHQVYAHSKIEQEFEPKSLEG